MSTKKQNLNTLNRELSCKKTNNNELIYDYNCYNQNFDISNDKKSSELLKNVDDNKKFSFCIDNTKRKNLDTSIYTNNPMKIQGRGFGNINNYGYFCNGIGISTRQDNQDKNPRNLEDNRINIIQHNNYN